MNHMIDGDDGSSHFSDKYNGDLRSKERSKCTFCEEEYDEEDMIYFEKFGFVCTPCAEDPDGYVIHTIKNVLKEQKITCRTRI